MKTKKVILLLIVIALAFCSCSKGGAQSVSLYDLKDKMVGAATKFSDMKYASSADDGAEGIFANITEMEYSKVEAFFVYYAADGTGNADEIAVIQVKNKKDVALAGAALEKHIRNRRALYATYDTSQLYKLDGAKYAAYGNVVCAVVCDEADAVSNAFYDYFNN